MKTRWPYITASILGLTGAFFDGITGSLIAAFAGDSWWASSFTLSCFQYSAAIGGGCMDTTPGMVWLL